MTQEYGTDANKAVHRTPRLMRAVVQWRKVMKRFMIILVVAGILSGCAHHDPPSKSNSERSSSDNNLIQQDKLPSLASLIGKKWQDVWQHLSADGVTIVETYKTRDGGSQHIIRNTGNKLGNVRLFVRNGVIDEVEAWAENALKPYFSTVFGVIQPGVLVEDIEKKHGKPIYVEFGKHGLRMKGWKIDDYLLFVTSNNGMFLTPAAGRVYAFHKDNLPSTGRMWSLKERITLQDLMDGKTYIDQK